MATRRERKTIAVETYHYEGAHYIVGGDDERTWGLAQADPVFAVAVAKAATYIQTRMLPNKYAIFSATPPVADPAFVPDEPKDSTSRRDPTPRRTLTFTFEHFPASDKAAECRLRAGELAEDCLEVLMTLGGPIAGLIALGWLILAAIF
jgi:hypothetical protein